MATVNDIRMWIDSFAPYDTAQEWDNSGLLLGRKEDLVQGVLVALDVTEEVIEEAVKYGADLILTHHPYLFSSLKRITDETPQGALLLNAAEQRISLLCAHTNLDMAKSGINALLCQILGIQASEEIAPFLTGTISREMNLGEFLQLVQEKLGCYGLKYTGELNQTIRKVSVCSGSGSEFLQEAALLGSDILLTSDAKYHDHQLASQLGIALADAGHFETERIICPVLVQKLQKKFPEIIVRESEVHQGFYRYYSAT